MKAFFLAIAFSVSAFAQGWYQTATPTNVLTCSLTNFSGSPAFYSVYYGTNGTMRRFNAFNMPVPFTNFLGSAQSALYSVQITATGTNGVETLPSTNAYIYWIALPIVPGAPVGLSVK